MTGDGIVGFEDFNQTLFDTSLQERDYFMITQKPCSDLANEPIIFKDIPSNAAMGDSIQSDFGRLSLSDNPGGGKISPYAKKDSRRPATSSLQANGNRPATSATEIHEYTKPASRPSTSMGSAANSVTQSLKNTVLSRQNQIWSDAARIAALTGGKETVGDIKHVLEKMRPKTSDSTRYLAETQYDQLRPPSRARSSLSQDLGVDKKPGSLPRNISAEQARQLIAQKSHTKEGHAHAQNSFVVQRGPAHEGSPHQPTGPLHRKMNPALLASRTVAKMSPPATVRPAKDAQGGANIAQPMNYVGSHAVAMAGAEAGKSKSTSNLFLMSQPGPSKGKGAAGAGRANGNRGKPAVGGERSRIGGGGGGSFGGPQSLTIHTPSFDATF
jgi:hypothetical protein